MVPDLPGCYSAGVTITAALAEVKEAIELHLEGLLEAGDGLPVLAPLEEHVAQQDYADGIWFVVEVDIAKVMGRLKRVNITIPVRVLQQIDHYVETSSTSRSAFLVEASLAYLNQASSQA